METEFRAIIETMRRAQEPLRREMVELWHANAREPSDLLRLEQSAIVCRDEAHSFLAEMLDRNAPTSLMEEAEGFVSFFNGVVDQIEAMLATSRVSS